MSNFPALAGFQLINLLCDDGWVKGRKSTHGRCLTKKLLNDRTLVTFIPETNSSLPEGTLHAILSSKQTRIGKKGLLQLIKKYGLR